MPWKNPEDHQRYQLAYQKRPEIVKRQSERKAARRLAEKKWGKEAIAGKDIDHIRPLDKGGDSDASNLRIRSRSANRGFARDSRNQPK